MLHTKGISDVSSMINESGNNQHCEYDIGESGEWNECWGGPKLEYFQPD